MIIRIAKVGSRNRVVLPPEVMDALGIAEGDALFFVVGQNGVRLSRSPETFGEYLQLHAGALPASDDPDDLDSRQMHFDWYQENMIPDEHTDR
ncbi:MAG TPA: AbrB/MazE/SpoVT family DNA-binding domain-containing protein [Anaerolineae bacterium]|nr:AbrB/MazE/SpoVT family DNA-binding domain-containing protein [Anaerolineae bacterium]HNU05473.1 AbrB/MazE/SpoVT family DNA-binding domain-containing protein [Anaerolineae bacterium]